METDNVAKLKTTTKPRTPPKRIVRPCEWGLRGVISNMEAQLGTVEAYNMLCQYAEMMNSRIQDGKIKEQNPLYATDPSTQEGIKYDNERPFF